jgi:arylsulfatase A-like enzyme
MKLPGNELAGQRCHFLVPNSDLACVVLDVLGLERPSSWTCRSFLPSLRTPALPHRPHLLLEGAHRTEIAVRSPRWLLRRTTGRLMPKRFDEIGFRPDGAGRQLFDLAADPEQRHDLIAEPGGRTRGPDALERQLDALAAIRAARPRRLDDADHLEALRALGYVQ